MNEPTEANATDVLMWSAAHGDKEAQMLMALGALMAKGEYVPRPNDPPVRELLIAAEVFARLAAVDNELRPASMLAAVLKARADDLMTDSPQRAEETWQEAAELMYACAMAGDTEAAACLIAELTRRADCGSEEAACQLNNVVAAIPPDTLAEVRAAEAAKVAA